MNNETTETNNLQQINNNNNNITSAEKLNTKDTQISLNPQTVSTKSERTAIFAKKQAKNLVDPLKAAKIVKKIFNLASKNSVVEQFKTFSPLDHIIAASAAEKSATTIYKRKLRMEDPYFHQFRVWTPYPLPPHIKPRFSQGWFLFVNVLLYER